MGTRASSSGVLRWLSSPENPPVHYLAARDLVEPAASSARLRALRAKILRWEPLLELLALQREDGGFGRPKKPRDARATFWALRLLARCGLDATDEPVARAIAYLGRHHAAAGALSYQSGGSGVLACYVGVTTAALIELGALDTELVQASLAWLVAHQRFDHKATRAGGDLRWPYRAPANYGCWESVSCYHGVAGAFRALAAIPPARRSADQCQRLAEALEYLRIHHLYKRSRGDRPLLRHLLEPALMADYRSTLLDMLEGIAAADPSLIREPWVRAAADDMEALTDGGKVSLARNYGRALTSPIPLEREALGEASRFLTYQWLRVRATLGL